VDEPKFPIEVVESGKTMALLARVGLLVGVPLFLIPFPQNDNAFATFHARHALATFVASLGLVVAWVVLYLGTCGLGIMLFPVLLITLVPTIDGLVKATSGRAEAPLLIGPLTDALFPSKG
jgi:hypothetical protein